MQGYWLSLVMLFSIGCPLANAAEPPVSDNLSLDCARPVQSGSIAIKETIGPLYKNGAEKPDLAAAAKRLDQFVTDATYCRVALQSRKRVAADGTIAEWLSLHQWLNRLADTLNVSAAETGNHRWRDEYTLFAEIYEFEP